MGPKVTMVNQLILAGIDECCMGANEYGRYG